MSVTTSPVTIAEVLARVEAFAQQQLDTPPSSTSEPVAYGVSQGVEYVAEGLMALVSSIRADVSARR